MKTLISLSKKSKKEKSPRQKFYSLLMTQLGGETGDNLAESLTSGKFDKFQEQMADVAKKIADKASKSKD